MQNEVGFCMQNISDTTGISPYFSTCIRIVHVHMYIHELLLFLFSTWDLSKPTSKLCSYFTVVLHH